MRIPRLLLEKNFRRFWTGQTISLLGDQITSLALPLTAVIGLHASAQTMSFLTAAVWVPSLLIGIHAGAWVDRRGRRRQTMMVADIARALLLLSIPVVYILGFLSIPLLLIVAFLIGIFAVFFNVSSNTLFVSLVQPESYVEANSFLNGSRAVSFLAGPSLAGILIQLLSAPITLIADALSFFASAISLARIHPVESPPAKVQPGHTSAGLRYIWNSSTLRYGLAAVATINLFNYVFAALFVLYASRILHVSPGLLGLTIGAGAVGSVLGSAVTSKASRRIGLGYALLLGTILFPAPLILVPLARGPHFVIVAFLFFAEFFSGLGVMVLDISYGAVLAAAIPDALRSRVAGAFGFINNGIRPVGALIGGLLSGLLGIHGALWIGTIGACLGFLWLLPSRLIRLRDVQDFIPVDIPPASGDTFSS